METVSLEVPDRSPLREGMEAELSPPEKREPGTGRFIAGVSGNPAGRSVGSQNKASLIKQFIEEKLSTKLEKDALAIMQKAINMAKSGDSRMIKLLLGDMLAATRNPANDSNSKGPVQVNVQIKNYTAPEQLAPIISITPIEVSESHG
jgi:hypothetical protein